MTLLKSTDAIVPRPSNLGLLLLCPGSLHLCRDLHSRGIININSPKSEAAEEGVLLHKAMATGKLDGLNGEQLEVIGRCRDMLDVVRPDGADVYQELLMSLWHNDIQLLTGTADVLIVHDETATLVDWKFGRGELRATMATAQLLAYAAMAMQTYHLNAVGCYIYQPRLKFGERTSELMVHDGPARTYIDRALGSEKPGDLRPTAEGCQYCPATGYCPEQHKLMEEACQALKE